VIDPPLGARVVEVLYMCGATIDVRALRAANVRLKVRSVFAEIV
jgi:hypothetical protein